MRYFYRHKHSFIVKSTILFLYAYGSFFVLPVQAGTVTTCLGVTPSRFIVSDFLNRKIARLRLSSHQSDNVKILSIGITKEKKECILSQNLLEQFESKFDEIAVLPGWFNEANTIAALSVFLVSDYFNCPISSLLSVNSVNVNEQNNTVVIELYGESQSLVATLVFLPPTPPQREAEDTSFTFQLFASGQMTTYTISYDTTERFSPEGENADSQPDDEKGMQDEESTCMPPDGSPEHGSGHSPEDSEFKPAGENNGRQISTEGDYHWAFRKVSEMEVLIGLVLLPGIFDIHRFSECMK